MSRVSFGTNSIFYIFSEEILFGVASTENDNKIKKLNFCLLYAKFYFHFQKINQRACNLDVFVRKLNFMLKVHVEGIHLVKFVLYCLTIKTKQNKNSMLSPFLLRKLNRIYPAKITVVIIL